MLFRFLLKERLGYLMRKSFAPFILPALCLVIFLTVQGRQSVSQQETCPDSSEVIKRGAVLGDAPRVALADALQAPKLFSGRTVRIEGVVERNCTDKGCWMELSPKPGEHGVRVTFKDYGFFIPLNSKGMKATAEGQFSVAQISKDEADHLEGEGARLVRNPDGTASEVAFVALGVELRK